MSLLESLAEYIADRLGKETGKQVFWYELPPEPAECISVIEKPTASSSMAQIDAISHRVKFVARAGSNTAAYNLASDCYRTLKGDDAEIDTDDTGFIKLLDGSYVYVFLRGEPVWEEVDQQKRKLFAFEATITTTKIGGFYNG